MRGGRKAFLGRRRARMLVRPIDPWDEDYVGCRLTIPQGWIVAMTDHGLSLAGSVVATAHRSSLALPFVSIIIVNYNGKHFLDDCLTSLQTQTYPQARTEVILVDNGSNDGSIEHLRYEYPWVRLLVAGKNLGFAQGNNEGIRIAKGQLIALLNNDTVVQSGWLQALVETIAEDPKIGGVTSKILFRNAPGIINSVGLNLYRDGRGGDRGFRQPDHGQFDEATDVFAGCGASLLLRREMLDDIGLFDERFFMYCEDLDLAWRAHFRGWRFRYTPYSVLYHVHCGSSGEWSPFFVYHAERNRVFANLKNAPAWLALRTLSVFMAKTARQWFWVISLQQRRRADWLKAIAYVRGGCSVVGQIPAMLWSRYQIRGARCLFSDDTFDHLISATPCE